MDTVNWIYVLTALVDIVAGVFIIAGFILLMYIIAITVIRIMVIDEVEFFICFIPNDDNDVMDLKYDMVKKLSKLIGCNRIYRADIHKCSCPDHYKIHLKCKLPSIINKNRLEFNMYQLLKTYSDKMKLISITRE